MKIEQNNCCGKVRFDSLNPGDLFLDPEGCNELNMFIKLNCYTANGKDVFCVNLVRNAVHSGWGSEMVIPVKGKIVLDC